MNDPKVYLLLGNNKHWITSETVFTALKYSWNWIEDITQSLLDKYTAAGEVTDTTKHPNHTIVKYANSSNVYRLEGDPVDPTKQVLVRQFGAIVGEPKTDPGLYAKLPLIQDIQRIDRRLLDYEAEEFEIIAGDQKRLVVDAYARYKIVAAKLYAQTVPGGETTLRGLLDSLINSEIRGVLSDPAFMNAIMSYDPNQIQQNEKTQYLLQNPKFQSLMEKIRQKLPASK